MASSLSRGSRPIGPVYNDTKRAARKLEREGYGRAAEALALQAAQQKLARGGSNITSAESNRDERDALEVAQSGLMRERADVAFRADAAEKGLTVEASGAQLTARKGLYERMRSGITPEMKAEAGKLGITDSGFAQASASAAKNPLAPVAGVTAPTTLTRPSSPPALGAKPAVGADAAYFTDKPFEFAAKEATETSRRLEMRAAEDRLTRPGQFGASYAAANLEKSGPAGALADLRRREAEAAKGLEPGNMADIRKRDGAAPSPSTTPGPMQTALNEAMARREGRAADAVGAAKITAGLNAAPTPRLDTSFPVAAPSAAPSPAATAAPTPPVGLTRPARSGAFNAGAKIHDAVAGFMAPPDYSKPALDSQGNPYATRGFTPRPQLNGRLTAPELTPEAKRAAEELKKKGRPVADFGSGLARGSR